MPLSGSTLGTLLKTNIEAKLGGGGGEMTKFTNAMGNGIVDAAIILTGTITVPAGAGASAGTGITGFTSAAISSGIVTKGQSFWPGGGSLSDIADAIGDSVVTHFAGATLASDANGACTFASFTGAVSAMATVIEDAETSFTGPEWGNFCTAVAQGICDDIGANGAGTLSGAPGGGPGAGVVTIA